MRTSVRMDLAKKLSCELRVVAEKTCRLYNRNIAKHSNAPIYANCMYD